MRSILTWFAPAHRRRTLVLAVLIASMHFGAIVMLMPRLDSGPYAALGPISEYKSCGSKGCDSGIKIGDVVLACAVSIDGPRFSCPKNYVEGKEALATYYHQETLMSFFGPTPRTNVIVWLSQDGRDLLKRSPVEIRDEYLFPGGLFWNGICLIMFFTIRQNRYFKKP